MIERLSGWMSLQQISISNPSDWGKSDSFDFKLQSNNTKHQNLRKRFTKFFFQRWTIIKYRHIGIFYNHLGEKKDLWSRFTQTLSNIFAQKTYYDLLQSNTTPTKRIRNIWRTTLNRNAPSLPVVYTKLDENDNMIIENLI